jgi:L-ascorbate 6-phosphate lactonase
MNAIRRFPVQKGSVAIWWLGQNGWIFKSPEGVVATVDPYLSDSCARIYGSLPIDTRRQVPVFINPEDLDVDLFLATHSHADHADPETISALPERVKQEARFVAPYEVLAGFEQANINPENVLVFHPKQEWRFRDVTCIGAFALPTDGSDLNHIGFVLVFGNGPRVYVTGDTSYHPLFDCLQAQKIDVMLTCINGGFNNLSPWEAARATASVQPKLVIPCHFDMMAGNSIPPELFENALKTAGCTSRCIRLAHMEPFVYPS